MVLLLGYGLCLQAQNFSLHVHHMKVGKALVELKRATGYSVAGEAGILDLGRRVSINVRNGSISDILSQLFSAQPEIGYDVKGKLVLLKRRKVQVAKNRKHKEKAIENSRPATPKISDKLTYEKELSEVLVIGYGTARRADVSSSIGSVNVATARQRSVSTFSEMLQGAAAGVFVNNNNASPGSSPNVIVRGLATANNSTSPLFVVNGIQMGTNISFLNPDDIEQIDILKDASATAVYGARGANGVVMVTMKKGYQGKPRVTGSAEFGINSLSRTLGTLSVEDYAEAIRKARANDNSNIVMPIWENEYNGQRKNINWQKTMSQTGAFAKYYAAVEAGTERVNGIASIGYYNQGGTLVGSSFRRFNLHLSFSAQAGSVIRLTGGADFAHRNFGNNSQNILDYALQAPSMDYTDDNGNIISPNVVNPDGSYGTYRQSSAQSEVYKLDNSYALAKDRDYSTRLEDLLTYANLQLTPMKGLTFNVIYSYLTNLENRSGYVYKTKRYNYEYNDGVPTLTEVPIVSYANNENSFMLTKANYYKSSLEDYATWKYSTPDLKLTVMLGNSISRTGGSWNSARSRDFPYETVRDIDLTLSTDTKQALGNYVTSSRFFSLYGRIMASWKYRYQFAATLRRDGSSNFSKANRWGTFPSVAFSWRPTEEPFLESQHIFDDLKLRIGWGITGNAGQLTDLGVAQMTTENVAYKFYDENAATDGGKTANGVAQIKPVDENLRWEQNRQWNFGLDAQLAGASLKLSLDYYVRTTSGLLLQEILRPSIGYQSIYTNKGNIVNHGLEVSVAGSHKIGQVGIRSQLTLTSFKNKVSNVGNDIFIDQGLPLGFHWNDINIIRNGWPTGTWYAYRTQGIFHSQEEIDEVNRQAREKGQSSYQQNAKPGDIRFVDVNGDGHITDADKTNIGNGYPKLDFGLTLNLYWKGFSFLLYGYGRLGQKLLSYSAMRLTLLTSADNSVPSILRSEYKKAWSATNANGSNPRLSINDGNWNMRASDFWVRRADFLKIATLRLGYEIPHKITHCVGLESVNIFVASDNVLCISPYNRYGDPESGGSVMFYGIDSGHYPSSRTIRMGVNIVM